MKYDKKNCKDVINHESKMDRKVPGGWKSDMNYKVPGEWKSNMESRTYHAEQICSCKEATVRELLESGLFSPFDAYFWSFITEDHLNAPLSRYGFEKCGLSDCLQRLHELSVLEKNGMQLLYPLYDRQELYLQHDRQEAMLFHFPAGTSRPYALIVPGGGFARQWGLIEGFAIAAALNKMEIPAFVLFHRTGQDRVIEKAIADLKRALHFIEDNAEAFSVQRSHYLLGGFSAGGTLASQILIPEHGFKKEGLPKPDLLLLGYSALSMEIFYDSWNNAAPGSSLRQSAEVFLRRIVGENITPEALQRFDPIHHLKKDSCPPVFLTANEDDPVVPFQSSQRFYEAAQRLGIPVKASFGRVGGHSYGLGNGLMVEGWLRDAVSLWLSASALQGSK